MITKEEICSLVSKAKCSLAKKNVKYYANLAVGKKSKSKLNELLVMRYYIKMLEAFNVVGDIETCNCCIEGDYTIEPSVENPDVKFKVQFNKNNEGYLYTGNQGNPFLYAHDEYNNTLTIYINELSPIIFEDFFIRSNCNSTFNDSNPFNIYYGTVGPFITPANTNFGTGILVTDPDSTPIFNLDATGLVGQYQAIADLFNETYGNTGWNLYYDSVNNTFTLTSNFNDDYTGNYTLRFYQVDTPGTPSSVNLGNLFTPPGFSGDAGNAALNISVSNIDFSEGFFIYQDDTFRNYTSLEDLVNHVNSNILVPGFELSIVNTNELVITAPDYNYNLYNLELNYAYQSPDYINIQTLDVFSGGFIEPTYYDALVDNEASSNTFVNDNPCEPNIIEQTCLTNDEAEKIYNELSKLI